MLLRLDPSRALLVIPDGAPRRVLCPNMAGALIGLVVGLELRWGLITHRIYGLPALAVW